MAVNRLAIVLAIVVSCCCVGIAFAGQGVEAFTLLVVSGATLLLTVTFYRLPWLAGVLIVGYFPLVPALKFFVSPMFGPTKDLVVLAALLASLVALCITRDRGFHAERDPWLIFPILVLCAIYIVNPSGSYDSAWLQGARLSVEALSLFLLGYFTKNSAVLWKRVALTLILVAVCQSALGIIQQWIGSDSLITDWHYAFGQQVRLTSGGQLRSFGTFDDPFNYAGYLLLAMAVCQHFFRGISPIVSIILATGIACSVARTDIILMFVLFGLLLLRYAPRRTLLFAGAAVGISAIALLATPPSVPASTGSQGADTGFLLTLNGRDAVWGRVLESPWDLVTGRGVGATGPGLARADFEGLARPVGRFSPGQPVERPEDLSYVDSSYLTLLADVGLPGLLTAVFIMYRVFAISMRGVRSDLDQGWCALGLGIVIALDGFTRSSLTAFPFGFVALFLLGLSLSPMAAVAGETEVADRPSDKLPS